MENAEKIPAFLNTPERLPLIVAEPEFHAPVTHDASASFMAQMMQAASRTDFPVEKMNALFDLHCRVEDRNAEKEFAADYALMAAELPKVVRNKQNTHANYKYATLDEINHTINPILGKYGFSTSTPIKEQTATHVTVEAMLSHKSGHTKTCVITMPMDGVGLKGNANKTDTQAIGSSVTYARRTALCALLNIAAAGDDKDGNAPEEKISEAQVGIITGKLELCAEDFKATFLNVHGAVADIPKANFGAALAALNAQITKQGVK